MCDDAGLDAAHPVMDCPQQTAWRKGSQAALSMHHRTPSSDSSRVVDPIAKASTCGDHHDDQGARAAAGSPSYSPGDSDGTSHSPASSPDRKRSFRFSESSQSHGEWNPVVSGSTPEKAPAAETNIARCGVRRRPDCLTKYVQGSSAMLAVMAASPPTEVPSGSPAAPVGSGSGEDPLKLCTAHLGELTPRKSLAEGRGACTASPASARKRRQTTGSIPPAAADLAAAPRGATGVASTCGFAKAAMVSAGPATGARADNVGSLVRTGQAKDSPAQLHRSSGGGGSGGEELAAEEPPASSTSNPLGLLDTQMSEELKALKKALTLPISPEELELGLTGEASSDLMNCLRKKGKGGRNPACDARLDPNIDPKKAVRIMANRLSAAKSKLRQKLVSEGRRVKLDMLASQKAKLLKELDALKRLCSEMEGEIHAEAIAATAASAAAKALQLSMHADLADDEMHAMDDDNAGQALPAMHAKHLERAGPHPIGSPAPAGCGHQQLLMAGHQHSLGVTAVLSPAAAGLSRPGLASNLLGFSRGVPATGGRLNSVATASALPHGLSSPPGALPTSHSMPSPCTPASLTAKGSQRPLNAASTLIKDAWLSAGRFGLGEDLDLPLECLHPQLGPSAQPSANRDPSRGVTFKLDPN